jgi:minor histocompatibility antigen H13
MLQVATSDIITGPTRLLFPRGPGSVGEAADFPYSLLGLGDIAIPGRAISCHQVNKKGMRQVGSRERDQ